jgi:DNA-binding SARP family transcriptional activator/predicted ATPase
MISTVQLSLLGPLQIRIGENRLLDLPMRKEMALLAYLALEHGHAHSRESLMALLWPDVATDKARLSLRVNLSNLKKRLQGVDVDALFHITPLGIQFVVGACRLDTVDFNLDLRSGDRHEHRGDELCDRCQPAFARAVALYRGTFLDGLYIEECQLLDEWLFMQRERFRMQMLDALERLSHFHLRRSEYGPALAYARKQLEIDPLHEQAHLEIMQIHVAQGDRTGALRQFSRCRAVLRDELGVEPSIEISELHQQILTAPSQDATVAAPPPSTRTQPNQVHLPIYLTPFVGRHDELSLLDERIRAGVYRLIVLVGAGGMGKTRLAIEAARQQIAHFADGVYFVPFASVQNAGAVIDTLAATFGIVYRADNRTLQEQLIDWLRPRHMLLVIDNFEHLLPASPLLLEILHAAPHLVMLITSREVVGMQAEDLIHVTGLPVAETEQVEEASRFSAVRLFVERAYRADKRFYLHTGNVADVVRICRLVEGRPLAIELAALHTANRPCHAIAEAIRTDFGFLAADLPDLPERQRSLSAVFEQSWQALSRTEQGCLSRLSLFKNPFDVEMAIAVAGASLPVLTRLHNAHLIQHHDNYERFGIHELLRQFAGAKLLQSLPDPSSLQRRHAEYFLTWLSRHVQILEGVQPMRSAEAIQANLDDVRAAWQWASTAQAADLLQRALPVLGAFYTLRGMHSEGEQIFRTTLAQTAGEQEGLRAQLLVRLGSYLEKQGKFEAARSALNDGLAIAQRLEDYQTFGFGSYTLARLDALAGTASNAIQILRRGLAALPYGEFLTVRAELLIYLGTLESQQGNRNAAAGAYEEVRRIVSRTGNKVQEQRLLLYQGIDFSDDNYLAAQIYFERAMDLIPDTGDRVLESRILNALGFVHARLGHYDEAIGYHLRGLTICTADQDAIQQSHALHNLCVDYYGLGRYKEAYSYGQEALAIAERNDLLDGIGYAQLHLGHLLAKMRLYGDAERALLAARDAFVRLERKVVEIEAEAGLAHVDQLVGQLPSALAHVNQVLTFLESHTLDGSDEPVRVYLHCYQALAACNDSRADALLEAGRRFVHHRAALLDEENRERYLSAVPANRAILEA